MSERVEIQLEGGDFDFDTDNIQELDHFDIGEEEDPEEVTAGEAGVWQEDVHHGLLPLSRQKAGKREPKKPGRKRKGEIIHIPKRQPPRAVRVKSYQQYDTFDEIIEEENGMEGEGVIGDGEGGGGIVMEDQDSDPEIIDEDGEPSTSKTFRVFVRKDGSGMHYDWPIYQDSSISLKDAVNIISTGAAAIQKSIICDSIPQEYTNTGTFIIHFGEEEGMRKEEICDDGLGTWNSAQLFVRKYIIDAGRGGPPLMTQKNDHNLKVVCEQFIHPGTDPRGDFLRKIYTGFDKDEHMIPCVVISYEWMGQPHPLTVYEDETDKQQTFEQMTWKKCSKENDQVPILSRHGCDYNAAVSILLSPEKFTSYGKSVPQDVQECISFVLDIDECGGPRALFVDGNEWQRPSGSHRFFRITYPNGREREEEDESTWNIERSPVNFGANQSDLQIVCRRYNGQKYSSTFGFVRKIFILKVLSTCPSTIAQQLVNRNLAVVSYSYRNAAVPTFIEQPGPSSKLPNGELVGEEVQVVTGEMVFDAELGPEMRQMMDEIEQKKKRNEQRLMEMIQRVQRLDEICKKEHWHSDTTSEVQQLLQIGAILESSLH